MSIFDKIKQLEESGSTTKSKSKGSKAGSKFNTQKAELRVSSLEGTIERLENTKERRIEENTKTIAERDSVKLEYGIIMAGIEAVKKDKEGGELYEEHGTPDYLQKRIDSIVGRIPRLTKTIASRITANETTQSTIDKAKAELVELKASLEEEYAKETTETAQQTRKQTNK